MSWRRLKPRSFPVTNNATKADAALAGRSGPPDASLTADDGLLPAHEGRLTYPFADQIPGEGKLTKISDCLQWARIPMPGSLAHINSWLIGDGSDGGSAGHAVVDTGLMLEMSSGAWKALFADALAGQTVTRVLCTHMHPDHIGLAGWLVRRFDAPLLMTRAEWLTAKVLVGDMRDEPPHEVMAMRRAAGWDEESIEAGRAAGWSLMNRVVFKLPFGYTRIVDGQLLKFGDSEWQVVVGNGHSPEHACFYNAKSKILISGDQVLPAISSNISLVASEPEANPLADWLRSIDRLMQLPDDLLVCPAHGEPFYGLHTRLADLRDGHLQRLDQLASALQEGERTVVGCFDLLFRKTIRGNDLALATGEALAHLRWLEVEGRISRQTRDGVWYWQAA